VNFQEVVHSVPSGEAEVVEASAIRRDRMNSHKNALLTAKGRESMERAVVDDGLSVATVARLYRTTPKTVAKMGGRASVRKG
jgi:hypothetical protein